ncbi:hypothetical protein [Actinokineospora sp. NBRC 105648]|uniref:hypothetical protein n=1 Tax=Actinokineospora sp. NBRC 105648 TaxID=3032206 RepID=UPI002555A059|nr:hypothetical protein [Actinokineospora sp. NBRC 105648]
MPTDSTDRTTGSTDRTSGATSPAFTTRCDAPDGAEPANAEPDVAGRTGWLAAEATTWVALGLAGFGDCSVGRGAGVAPTTDWAKGLITPGPRSATCPVKSSSPGGGAGRVSALASDDHSTARNRNPKRVPLIIAIRRSV